MDEGRKKSHRHHGRNPFPASTTLASWLALELVDIAINLAHDSLGPLNAVNGELHKLAHNITFGHGLHGGIHWRSDSDASIQLGEAVAISFLHDLVCTYSEPCTISITKLDGSAETLIYLRRYAN
jgi:hypothetical protein